MVDYFTKWFEAEATENITSQDVIKFLINVFARHGREEKTSMYQTKRIKPGDSVLVRNFNRTKFEPYFVGPMKVVKKQFNTVTLADPATNIQMNRNVHLKNIVKFNSAST